MSISAEDRNHLEEIADGAWGDDPRERGLARDRLSAVGAESLTALKACPFCGSQAGMEPWHGGAPTKQMISCTSDECEVAPMVTGETPDEAVTRWNTRFTFT